MARTRSKATARKKKKTDSDRAKASAVPVVQQLYTPERAEMMGRLASTLWDEMRAWLDVLETELLWLGGGGEAPVLACRARVRMMGGVLRGLEPDLSELCVDANDELEAWRWLDELDRSMGGWLEALNQDLKDAGMTPRHARDPRDDTWFTPEYGRALGCLRETYSDWWFVANKLATIDAQGMSAGEIRRVDQRCARIGQQARARRAVLKAMPKRDLRWGCAEARSAKFVL
jgi:hypothetical protein